MKVRIPKNYIGSAGMFFAGMTYDLAVSKIATLLNHFFGTVRQKPYVVKKPATMVKPWANAKKNTSKDKQVRPGKKGGAKVKTK